MSDRKWVNSNPQNSCVHRLRQRARWCLGRGATMTGTWPGFGSAVSDRWPDLGRSVARNSSSEVRGQACVCSDPFCAANWLLPSRTPQRRRSIEGCAAGAGSRASPSADRVRPDSFSPRVWTPWRVQQIKSEVRKRFVHIAQRVISCVVLFQELQE
jgi:hypothetical protein